MHTILLVQKHADILEAFGKLLRAEGYEVLTAGSGEEGLLIAEDNEVDLMITGMVLPGASGMKFLRVFKEWHPAIPAIVCTAVPPKRYWRQAELAGATAWVQKPFEAEELLDAVESSIRASDTCQMKTA